MKNTIKKDKFPRMKNPPTGVTLTWYIGITVKSQIYLNISHN